jgi:outer membrane protein assembly factor BamB
MSIRLSLALSACILNPLLGSLATDWPQFRGPAGTGLLANQNFPSTWSSDGNIAWSAKLPGSGWSSPVTTGDHVFVTTAVFEGQNSPKGFRGGVSSMRTYRRDSESQRTETRFELHCLNLADGKTLWTKEVIQRKPAFIIHPSNTYATESPATDGKHVFAYFAAAGIVAAFDLKGTPVWRADLGAYPAGNGFGSGSSLALHECTLFVQCDNDEKSFVVALDTASGKEIWRHSRDSRTSWSTPIIWKNDTRTVLVTLSAGRITGHNLETGEPIWKLDGFDGSFSASPAATSNRLFFGNSGPGSRGPLAAIDSRASGDLDYTLGKASKSVPWTRAGSGPGLSSPVAYEGLLYVIAGTGILSCYDCQNGERIYQERLPNARSVAASLWIAGDKLFALDESGQTFILKTGRKFEVLRTNRIDDLFWSTPAISGDSLLLRGAKNLYCVRKNKSA